MILDLHNGLPVQYHLVFVQYHVISVQYNLVLRPGLVRGRRNQMIAGRKTQIGDLYDVLFFTINAVLD